MPGLQRRPVAALLAAAVIAVPAWAAPAQASEWRVLPAESRIGFTVPFVMNGIVLRGGFRDWDAAIRFDPDRPDAAAVRVRVRTASAFTGDREADADLPSPEWLATLAFPEAQFVVDGVRRLAPGAYEAAGSLTLRGVTRPVVLPFALEIVAGRARMRGEVALDRLAFGIGDGPDPDGNIAGIEVRVAVDLVAERQP